MKEEQPIRLDTAKTDVNLQKIYEINIPDIQASQMINRIRNSADFEFQVKHITRTHLMNAAVLRDLLNSTEELLQGLNKYELENLYRPMAGFLH